ncbi:hypothetical protein TEA_011257 [Camellia sinensis var. sinensis]|uniref:Rab-GAP TBC domain-containing protein n=1 Tax=Camellia sinensis var. sinensis TaxID=542762 RepID=A0A4S4D4X1_CAMSN|nr:hypothetical protein TEA_011257 [Camellia sinensis var. sinensis]
MLQQDVQLWFASGVGSPPLTYGSGLFLALVCFWLWFASGNIQLWYPDVAKFHEKPLTLADDMDKLFSDVSATGEWAYTPSSGVFLDTKGSYTPLGDDTDTEIHSSELRNQCRRQKEGPSKKQKGNKKQSAADELNKTLNHIVDAVEASSSTGWMLYAPIVLVFYESEANQTKRWNILAIYAWVDNSIGYVQGMNDICSPMVILMENEADTFWCFERAMRRSNANSIGVQSQLSALTGIMKAVDPKVHQHLGTADPARSGNRTDDGGGGGSVMAVGLGCKVVVVVMVMLMVAVMEFGGGKVGSSGGDAGEVDG